MSDFFNRFRRPAVLRLLLVATFLVAAPPIFGQTSPVARIEEDWELVIGEPSPGSDAPQITCLISPVGNLDSLYAAFMVNNQDIPSFTAGGLQLQIWNGKNLIASRHFPNQAVLTTVGEPICWTQVMQKTADGMMFAVINGTSATWGAFGNDGSLRITVPTAVQNLAGYSQAFSAANSGVSFAANRVRSLTLKRVRAYDASGLLLAEETVPRVVYPLNP